MWWFTVCLQDFIKAIQLFAFMENRGFRRVQVFRCTLLCNTATKTNDSTSTIANWEHDSSAKAVITAAVIVFNQHTCGDKHIFTAALLTKIAPYKIPFIRYVSNAKFLDDFSR
ncbi:Uncharacterised protein [Vibrio cholerae]|nr:Uncharacterised protein [Vibrio cholerae]